MAEQLQFRKLEASPYSPKLSPAPRGSRSPLVLGPRPDSTGTLKATISLGKNPTIVHSGPFYLIKESPGESELTGATNLMAHYGLEHSYNKSAGRKVKDTLSSFLPHLPGLIDSPGYSDNSSLRSVIDKPPIGGKELLPLNYTQLSGFRLHPGALPDQYRLQNASPQKSKRHKHKKAKFKGGGEMTMVLEATTTTTATPSASATEMSAERKHKKQRRNDEEKEKKKKKKEKKEKRKEKKKTSPEHA